MNRLHYTKSKRQLHFEKVVRKTIFVFLLGVICGAGATTLIHKCKTPTVETLVIQEETVPTPTEVVKPTEEVKAKEVAKTVETPKINKVATPTPTPKVENTRANNLRSLGKFKLTAYCACKLCCGKSDGITASGVKAVEGVTIAADTSILPFGTKVLIDDHEYTVQDRGGAIKGNKIDIYFENHKKAQSFGVQYKNVYIKGV